jgi:hypothetical protein
VQLGRPAQLTTPARATHFHSLRTARKTSLGSGAHFSVSVHARSDHAQGAVCAGWQTGPLPSPLTCGWPSLHTYTWVRAVIPSAESRNKPRSNDGARADLVGLLLPPGHDLLVWTIRPGHALLLLILVWLDERTMSRVTWDRGERDYRVAVVGHITPCRGLVLGVPFGVFTGARRTSSALTQAARVARVRLIPRRSHGPPWPRPASWGMPLQHNRW